jgi:hypothetical protein
MPDRVNRTSIAKGCVFSEILDSGYYAIRVNHRPVAFDIRREPHTYKRNVHISLTMKTINECKLSKSRIEGVYTPAIRDLT